jgi:hypothetical protein
MTAISLTNIKQLYPNEWVLIGNPTEKNGDVFGEVVIHEKDKKQLVNKAVDTQLKNVYDKTILRFTGELPTIGKWLKFIQ